MLSSTCASYVVFHACLFSILFYSPSGPGLCRMRNDDDLCPEIIDVGRKPLRSTDCAIGRYLLYMVLDMSCIVWCASLICLAHALAMMTTHHLAVVPT